MLNRRSFVKHAGCAVCAVGAEHLLWRATSPAAAEAYSRLDRAGRLNFSDMALALAKAAGASYADMRIGRSDRELIRAREARIEEFTSTLSVSFGVRVLVDGSWGFAGSELVEEDEIKRAVAQAVENAKAAHAIQATPIVLEEIPAYQEDWHMPMKLDPFTVSADAKAARLIAVNDAALKAGADFCSSLMSFVREEKTFASSRGSRITQTRLRSSPY